MGGEVDKIHSIWKSGVYGQNILAAGGRTNCIETQLARIGGTIAIIVEAVAYLYSIGVDAGLGIVTIEFLCDKIGRLQTVVLDVVWIAIAIAIEVGIPQVGG